MDVLVLVGRILFSALFLYTATGHLTATNQLAQWAEAKGVPAAKASVVVGGLLLLAGGFSVLLGVWADLGALLLAIFLIPTALLMHAFWQESGEDRMREQVQFFKDLALAGAALMLVAFFSFVGHELGYTITGPFFDIT